MAVAGSDCGKTILLLHVVRELQQLKNNNNNNNNDNNNNNEKRKKDDDTFYTTACLRSQARLALKLYSPPSS